MRAAFLAPILPQVMEEGESKKAALILMKNSHFDRTLRYNPFNERFLDRAMKQIQLLNKLGHGTICVFKLVPSEGWI